MNDLVFGLEITAAGMGLVFGLLAVLWALLTLLLRLDSGAEPADEAAAEPATEPATRMVQIMSPAGLDADTLAAITIAVLTHAAVRRKQAAPTMRSYRPGSLLYASRWVASGRARQHQHSDQRR